MIAGNTDWFARAGVRPVATLLALIWIVSTVGFFVTDVRSYLALVPRSGNHLLGVVTMPFVHIDLAHLLTNSVPLLIMGVILSVRDRRRFLVTLLLTNVALGALVWTFGRPGAHIGASGMVFGMFGVILANAVLTKSFSDVAIGFMVVALFGGLVWGIVPVGNGVSWEAHLFGLISGAGAAFLMHFGRGTGGQGGRRAGG